MVKRKIALFGGTFDPVHLGHTAVAADAAQLIGAEKIIFIPAKRSPLKGFFPKAGDSDRLKMIALAIADNKNFEVIRSTVMLPYKGQRDQSLQKLLVTY